MFRELRRFKQTLPAEECVEVLTNELRGILSVQGDDGYPYGVPLNHWYNPETGVIYFHSGKGGHKLDSIKRSNKVSFCVHDSGFRKEGHWALNIRSVIVFGRAEIVEDWEEASYAIRQLCYKFTQDEEYIDRDFEKNGPATVCFCIKPEFITGKLVNES